MRSSASATHISNALLAARVVLAHEGLDRALVGGAGASRRTRSAAVAWTAARSASLQSGWGWRAATSSPRVFGLVQRPGRR